MDMRQELHDRAANEQIAGLEFLRRDGVGPFFRQRCLLGLRRLMFDGADSNRLFDLPVALQSSFEVGDLVR
ncbi:hypothetical protein [Sinorhizobium medicae]|uniref:hypothetical protein n=1 Tax=Sinorhizobium medicae TaxID=110321 RepID=UPI002B1BE1B4|nr:hypothetical protein [Sinorhizobium medicae]